MFSQKRYYLTPSVGIALFCILYIIAALLYPGGTKIDRDSEGFSLLHNYWCDLFDIIAYNGQLNPARPIAISAMILLSCSLGLLWWWLPIIFSHKNLRLRIMQLTGIAAMFIMTFLFTAFHEEVIHLGGLLGGISLILTFSELYQSHKKRLFLMGLVCLLLSSFNYFVYQTQIFLFVLAMTQKITFIAFFIWAILLNIEIYHKVKGK